MGGRPKGWAQGLVMALVIAIGMAAAPYAHFEDMTILLLPAFIAWDYAQTSSTRTAGTKLIVVCCAALFVWPLLLLVLGGHYWWNSRIYLTFPVLLLFIVSLVLDLRISPERRAAPVPDQPQLE